MADDHKVMVILQKMGTMPDGKIQFLAGGDTSVFNLEEGDEIFTVMFMVNPFEEG